MSQEGVEMSGDDLVRAFLAGIAAWERPPGTRAGREAAPGAGGEGAAPIRMRGAVRTRGAVGTGEPEVPFAFTQDDPVVKAFQAGIHRWENPYKSER